MLGQTALIRQTYNIKYNMYFESLTRQIVKINSIKNQIKLN